MARLDPTELVRDSTEFSNGEGISGAFIASMVAMISAAGIAAITVLDAVIGIFVEPLGAMAGGSADVLNALIGGSADIINQGATTAVTSIAPGQEWAIGPVTWLLAVALMGATMWLFAQILQVPATSDMLPFTGTDVPGAGAEEEDG